MDTQEIILGELYSLKQDGKEITIRAVNGEKMFNEPGISHGIVHFAHPKTGKKMGFCGTHYFKKHAIKV